MGLGETFAGWYGRAEESFFNFADWLDEKGIPAYGVITPLEDHGLPAFPVVLSLIVVLLAAVAWFFLLQPAVVTLNLSLSDDSGAALSGVSVRIADNAAKELFAATQSNGDAVELKNVPAGSTLRVSASKSGFDDATATVQVKSATIPVALSLPKQVQSIVATMRLVDDATLTPIANALVTLRWGNNQVQNAHSDQNGFVSFLSIPANEKVQVDIAADNYEPSTQQLAFADGSTPTLTLSPKSGAAFGNASLFVKTFDKATKNPLSDVLVDVSNPQTGQGLLLARTVDGQLVADLPKGTIFRVTATKPGFIAFSSGEQTLRENPTELDVELEQGGNHLHVNVVDTDSNVALFDATVGLYFAQGDLVLEKKTGFTGSLDFSELSPDQNYFLTAYKTGFVPQTKVVSPFNTAEVTMALEAENQNNMTALNVLVTDSTGFPGNNAGLDFFELIAGKPIPIGLPPAITAYDGYASVRVPASRLLLVRAQKGFERGDANLFIEPFKENNLGIHMLPSPTAKILRVLDMDGNPFVKGLAHVESVTGEILLDANVGEDGSVLFDAKSYKQLNVTIADRDGNSFSVPVNVEGKKEIVVQWPPVNSTELAAPIAFLGIEDADGKTVQGIAPNGDYWLKFRVEWVKGNYRGGVHVRVGNDSVKFADSQEMGISGFDAANVSGFVFSRSYSAFPAPGNEAADFSNTGKAGESNKWIELYFNHPSGTQVFRVKVKLKEGFSQTSLPIHYRSWAFLNGRFERFPSDAELGSDAFSSSKTSLYAQTKDETVALFANKETCEQSVCVEYRFVSEDGDAVAPEEFKALRGKKYALEMSVRATEKTGLLVRAATDKKTPKLYFTGSEVETFTEFLDSAEPNSFVEINNLSVLANSVRTARLYFKPFKAGNSSIKAQVIGENLSLEKDFFFNIFEQSEMAITVEPQPVLLGQRFSVALQDTNHGKPINDATIHVRDEKGSIVASTVGNNSADNGQNGRYAFSDSIGAGHYVVEATAFGFAPARTELTISATNILKLPPEIFVVIPKKQASAQAMVPLQNTSNLSVNDISVEIHRAPNWPIELDALGTSANALRANQKTNLDITATHAGDSNQAVSGTADVIVTGIVSGKYPAVATTHLTLSYNQPLNANCLAFDQNALTVFLAANAPLGQAEGVVSRYGNAAQAPFYPPLSREQYLQQPSQFNAPYTPQYQSASDRQFYANSPNSPSYQHSQYAGTGPYTGTGNIFSNVYSNYDQTAKEIELQVTNNCPQALQVNGTAIPKTDAGGDSGLGIEVVPFSVQPNETIITKVRIANQRERLLPQKEAHDFELSFTADGLTKTVPLKVVLWDSRFALAVRDQVVLFLSQSQKGEPVITSTPLFMRNVGSEDIKNLDVEWGDSFLENVSLRTIPLGRVPLLKKGQVVFPPKLLVAEKKGGTEKGKAVHSYLAVTGEIDGKRYLLRTIDVWVHVSALNCLFLTPVDDLEFISPTQLVIDKKVRIRNTCEEPVRVVGIEPSQLGAVQLFVLPVATDLLDRDKEAEFILRLSRTGDYKNENLGVSVAGLTQLTQKFISSNRLPTRMELGETAASTGLASESFKVNVCKETGASKTETTDVRFPKIARTSDCAKGYCDAQQAVDFLSKKLDDKIAQAQSVIGKANNQLENFVGCVNTAEQKACTFTELGVPSETFDLYLQNDQVSIDLLQKQFAEKGPAKLANYGVGYCAGPQCEIKSVAQTGFPNFLYVSNNLHGCGVYHIRVDGAAFVQQNQVRNEAFILAITVQNKRVTPECTNDVENVINFLPVDTGLTAENNVGAWPGVVEAGQKLTGVGKTFAKELFGTEEGRLSANAGTNTINVQFGDVQNGLVKIELDPTTSLDQPKMIIATISQALNTEGANKKDLATEAAQAVASLKKQRIAQGQGCIAPDHSYLILGSAAKLGDLSLTGKDSVNVLPHQRVCTDLSVTSPIKESVQLRFNKEEFFNTNTGIATVVFQNPEKNNQTLGENEAVALVFSEKNKRYEASAAVCVEGNEQFSLAKNAKPLEITAQSMLDSLRQSTPKKINLQICGIHPFDLITKVQSLQPGEYFATVGWKGEPSTTKLSEITNKAGDKGALNDKDKLLQAPNVDVSKQAAGKDALRDQRISAVIGFPIPGVGGHFVPIWKSYLPLCMLISSGCNGVRTVGLFGWAWGPILDCVAPATWMIASDVGGLKQAREWISKSLGSVSSYIIDKWVGLFPGNLPDQTQLVDGALIGVSVESLWNAWLNMDRLSSATIQSASGKIASDVADQIVEQQVAQGRSVKRELKQLIVNEIQPNVQKTLEEKVGGYNWRGYKARPDAKKVLQESVTETIGKTNLDAKLLDFALQNKSDLKSGASLASQTGSLDELAAKKIAEGFADVTIEGVANAPTFGQIITGIPFDEVAVRNAAGVIDPAATRALMWDRFMDKVRLNEGFRTLSTETQDKVTTAIQQKFFDRINALPALPTEAELARAFNDSVADSTRALSGLESVAASNAHDVATAMTQQIETKSGKTLSAADKTAVTRQIETALKGKAKFDVAIKQGISVAPTDVKDALRTSAKSELKELSKTVLGGANLERAAGKGPGAFTKFTNFFKGLARGLICGGAANWVGMEAARLTMQEPVQSNAQTTQVAGAPVVGSDGQAVRDAQGNVTQDVVFEKGGTYKVSVTNRQDGAKTIRQVRFEKVSDLKTIAPNASFLNTDCTGAFADKTLEGYRPKLDTETKDVTKSEALSYQLTASIIDETAQQHRIPPALIVTALSLEQKYSFAGQCDASHVWLNNASGSTQQIECAATHLQAFYTGDSDADIQQTLAQYYSQKNNAPAGFVDEGLKTFKRWQGSKTS